MRNLRTLAAMALLIWTASAQADAVTTWNEVAVQAAASGRPGPPGLFDIAIVQTAVHDAVQAIEGNYEPYAYADRSKRGLGSPAAAVAAAAHRALVLLYPSQQAALDATYDHYLANNGLTGDPALAVGEAAAQAVYGEHYRPVIPVAPFYGGTNIGEWRSTTPMAAVYAASVEPFTLNRASQFRPEPPPPMTSSKYLRDYAEVKAIGASSAHPNAGTEIARFWSVDYVRQWNEALRDVANRHVTNIGDSARLFALASLAASDAFIAVWECKIHYNFWRPSTAIQQTDSTWTPLIADPPYPDYVSGANGLSGAFTRTLQLFFGTDDLELTVKTTSPLVTNQTRHYTRISDAMQEVVDARVYLGIHFRFADEEGRRLGSRVAHWTFMKYLRPVNDRASRTHGRCESMPAR